MKDTIFDAIILGAGPYGLSIAAELKKRQLNVAVFGRVMSLWKDHMPKGMLLRSRWWDTSFSADYYSIANYFEYLGEEPYDPLPETTIMEYGIWFQKHAVGHVDETFITNIQKKEEYFVVTLADGRVFKSYHMVMAPGLGYYVSKPLQFARLRKEFVSHTFDNLPSEMLKGKRIAIIGGGQSGIENAALLSESGMDVHVIHRSPINWLAEAKEKNWLQYMRSPKAAISDGWDNWILEHSPYAFHRLPRSLKTKYLSSKGKNGPAASHWLIPRTKNVVFHSGQRIETMYEQTNHVTLKLTNGTTLDVNHIILATGYLCDVTRLSMLDPMIIRRLNRSNGTPVLNNYFESTVPGLYFSGFTSAKQFGPIYRFVAGSNANALRIAVSIKRKSSLVSPKQFLFPKLILSSKRFAMR